MKNFTRIEPTTIQSVGNRFKRRVVIKKFQTEDGLEHEFTTIYGEGSRSAAVIALTPDSQVITVYQFRAGPEKWMYDLPGGGAEVDESDEATALRELEEETGYVPQKLKLLGEGYGDGYKNSTCSYYLAINCTTGGRGRRLDTEESDQGAEVRLLTISEFIEKAKRGEMTDPHAVLMAYEKLKQLEEA